MAEQISAVGVKTYPGLICSTSVVKALIFIAFSMAKGKDGGVGCVFVTGFARV